MSKQLQNSVYEKRITAEMTQEDLGRKISVTRQTIIAIEKCNYTPSVSLALALAKVFNTSVEDLFWYD